MAHFLPSSHFPCLRWPFSLFASACFIYVDFDLGEFGPPVVLIVRLSRDMSLFGLSACGTILHLDAFNDGIRFLL